jgi:hypothetical protein
MEQTVGPDKVERLFQRNRGMQAKPLAGMSMPHVIEAGFHKMVLQMIEPREGRIEFLA